MVFRLGRRKGLYRRLDDLSNSSLYSRLKIIVDQYAMDASGQMDRDIDRIRQNYI